MTTDSLRLIAKISVLYAATISSTSLAAADPYRDVISPYLQKYCNECHTGTKPKGDLNFSRYTEPADIVASFRGTSSAYAAVAGWVVRRVKGQPGRRDR